MEDVTVHNGELVFACSLLVGTGDVDGDGALTTMDARTALRMMLNAADEWTTDQRRAADMDRNGRITTADIRLMLRQAMA